MIFNIQIHAYFSTLTNLLLKYGHHRVVAWAQL